MSKAVGIVLCNNQIHTLTICFPSLNTWKVFLAALFTTQMSYFILTHTTYSCHSLHCVVACFVYCKMEMFVFVTSSPLYCSFTNGKSMYTFVSSVFSNQINQSKPLSRKSHARKKKIGKIAEFCLKIFGIFCSDFSFEVHLTPIFDGKVMTAGSHESRCNASRSPYFAEFSYTDFQQCHVKWCFGNVDNRRLNFLPHLGLVISPLNDFTTFCRDFNFTY